jgi:hypothetical protein
MPKAGASGKKGCPALLAALRAPVRESNVCCHIAGLVVERADVAAIALRRKATIAFGGQTLPTSFLKHAEDQTVLAVHAVLNVITRQCWHERSFANWGVLAAADFFGRATNAQTIERFRADGAWGVSPHVIPHQSFHAISGTISQALQIHGPNLGAGSGPNTAPDAILLALTILAGGELPGVWLVLSGHESEYIPQPGVKTAPPRCVAAALALTPGAFAGGGAYLAIDHARAGVSSSALYPDFDLLSFLEAVSSGAGKWRLSDSHWLTFAVEPPK